MRWNHPASYIAGVLLIASNLAGECRAQGTYYRGTVYGRAWQGYPPASPYYRGPRYPVPPRGAQTVTDYRTLIRAITSLPGWNGKAAAPVGAARVLPSIPRQELLTAEGKILWPAATPDETRLMPARLAAEAAVALVAREERTYGQASIRHAADARNKLTEFARRALAPLKERDRAAAGELERFIVELQEALATMTAHY